MNAELLGISILTMGIWQLFVARKTYINIQKNVKNPQPFVFYGVYFSLILGGMFIVGGVMMIL